MKTCLRGLSFHKSPHSLVNMPIVQTSISSMVVLMLLLSTSLLTGCGGISGGISDIINPGSNNPDVLTVSPLSKTVSLGGSLELSASGGSEPYNFDLYYGNGTVTAAGTTGTYQAPTAEGTAVVRVQDTKGHAGYATIEITDDPIIQPASKSLAISNKFPFSALSGKAPYTFSIVSGGGAINATTGEFTAGTTAGTVVIRLTDADGRSSDANITVNAALNFATSEIYVEKEATYSLSATGGVPPYTFLIASGAGSVDGTTGVFTAPSAFGVTAVHVVDSIGNFDLAMLNTTTALSISPSNALIAKNSTQSFTANGGVPPYSYSIVAGGAGSVSALTGQYTAPGFVNSDTVRVTDALGHTSDASVTVTNSLSFSVANVTLAVGNTMNISTLVTGGVAPLTYTVPSSQGTFSGSTYTAPNTPGTYTITVYDSQSPTPNSVTTTALVNSALSLMPNSASLASTTEKSFSASGGVPPYTYSVQSGGGSITAADGLYTAPAASGNTVLLVTDAHGNTATAAVTIQESLTITPATKTLSSGGNFTFTASGGSAPYAFILVSGSGTINSSSGLYTAPGSSGLATLQVKDSAGNTKDALITILDPLSISPPTISLIKNGSITFTASGGASPYTFSVTTGNGSIDASTGVFTGPATSGSSTVRVTDSLGNTKDAAVTVYDSLAISPFTKSLTANQTFTFTATEGVSPYEYSLVSGVGSISTAGVYSSNAVGTSVVRVTDSSGNTSDADVSVNAALAISPTSKTLGANNYYTFSATGGVPPYAFSIFSGGGTVTTTGDFKAASSSSNTVLRVTDSAGNTSDATITVNNALTITPVTATVGVGGTQSFTAAGGVSPYTYTVVTGGGSFTAASYTAPSLASGTSVNVLVTDSLGNTANATVTINPITVTMSSPNSSDIITNSNKATFSVSGTCSESGRSVAVSATDGVHAAVTATPNCTAGTWSTSLNLTSLNDGAVTITANHSNVNGVAATTATVTLTKDGTLPTIAISAPTGGSTVSNSISVSGTCTKAGPVNLSTASGSITSITSCSAGSYTSTLDASSAVDGGLIITVNHTDSAGNAATPATVSVTKDSAPPVITAFAVTNSSPTNSTTFNLTFTATGSPTQYCILENSTTVGGCSWQNTPVPTSFTVNSTNNAKILTAWLKDAVGNVSTSVNSNSVTLETGTPAAPSTLSLTNPSSSPGSDTTPTILVSGVSVGDTVTIHTDSACLVGNQKGTATVGSGTTFDVTSSALTAGTYTFYAKRTTAAGNTSACSTANVSYQLDTTAPGSPSISINAAAAYTNSTTVVLTLSATDASDMYITNTAGCGSGGAYETYATSKSGWTLSTANASNTVYVKFKDAVGNETACINDTIIHDSTGPDAPTGLSLGSVPSSEVTTPTLSWTAPADNSGGSGVASYQVQVYKTADNTVVATWATSTSGAAVTISSGTLVNGTQYYMKVRAIDNAGNNGSAAQSSNWTATSTVPCFPSVGTLIYSTAGTYTTTVPAGCSHAIVKAWGAGGGGGSYYLGLTGNNGGGGGYATGDINVTPGGTLSILVGGGGAGANVAAGARAAGGSGGGGNGGFWSTGNAYNAGAGGGRSEVQFDGTMVLTAGGGGGGGAGYAGAVILGGGGCGADGVIGQAGGNGDNSAVGGGGGTSSAGGAAVSGAVSGSLGTGGKGSDTSYATGGGGGGGYYGGGGGEDGHVSGNGRSGGGGGGSCYVPAGGSSMGATNATAANNTDPDYTNNAGKGGNGNSGSGVSGNPGKVMVIYSTFAIASASPTSGIPTTSIDVTFNATPSTSGGASGTYSVTNPANWSYTCTPSGTFSVTGVSLSGSTATVSVNQSVAPAAGAACTLTAGQIASTSGQGLITSLNSVVFDEGTVTCSGTGVTQTARKCIFAASGNHSVTVTSQKTLTVKAWGAGGGGGSFYTGLTGNNGGGGGYSTGSITIQAGTATVLVGGGGIGSNASAVRSVGGVGGGGDAGFYTANNGYNAGAGGGRSAVIVAGTDLITAGGGGGGPGGYAGAAVVGGGGCGADNVIGQSGGNGESGGGTGGGGGTSSAGGTAGNSPSATVAATNGNLGTGGNGGDVAGGCGGGGGGGYYGGGGGGGTHYTNGNARGAGGGGGACYAPAGGSSVGATNSSAANNGDSDYANSAGAGGSGLAGSGTNGNPGLIIITW